MKHLILLLILTSCATQPNCQQALDTFKHAPADEVNHARVNVELICGGWK